MFTRINVKQFWNSKYLVCCDKYVSLSSVISIIYNLIKERGGEGHLQKGSIDQGCGLGGSVEKHFINIISHFASPSVLMKRGA
jgi:hypothetical protein